MTGDTTQEERFRYFFSAGVEEGMRRAAYAYVAQEREKAKTFSAEPPPTPKRGFMHVFGDDHFDEAFSTYFGDEHYPEGLPSYTHKFFGLSEDDFAKRAGRELFEVEYPDGKIVKKWLDPKLVEGLDDAPTEFADRSHLRRVQITDKNGKRTWVWKKPPEAGAEAKGAKPTGHPENTRKTGEGEKYHPTRRAEEAIAAHLADPSKINPDQFPELANHLDTLQKNKLQQIARDLATKISGKKQELVDRLLAKLREGAKPKEPEASLPRDDEPGSREPEVTPEPEIKPPPATPGPPPEPTPTPTPTESPIAKRKRLAATRAEQRKTQVASRQKAVVDREASRNAVTEPTPTPSVNVNDPKQLADAVHEAATYLPSWTGTNYEQRAGKSERHGVWIGEVFDKLKEMGKLPPDVSLDEFKKGLLQAHQAGDLSLSRNDLPQVTKEYKKHGTNKEAARSEIAHNVGPLQVQYHKVQAPTTKPAPDPVASPTPSTGSPVLDSLAAAKSSASPVVRDAIEDVLFNATDREGKPHADLKVIARRLVSAWEGAHDKGATPDELKPLTDAMAAHGLKSIGEKGEQVGYKGELHEGAPIAPGNAGHWTGDRHEVVRPGWELPRGDGGTTVIGKAKTRKAAR